MSYIAMGATSSAPQSVTLVLTAISAFGVLVWWLIARR
jgi:hypothetical protein